MRGHEFAQDRYRPEGKWERVTPILQISDNLNDEILKYFKDVRLAISERRRYGLLLDWRRGSQNIAVYGYVERRFFPGRKIYQINYVPHFATSELFERYIKKKVDLSAELHHLFWSYDDRSVFFYVLAGSSKLNKVDEFLDKVRSSPTQP